MEIKEILENKLAEKGLDDKYSIVYEGFYWSIIDKDRNQIYGSSNEKEVLDYIKSIVKLNERDKTKKRKIKIEMNEKSEIEINGIIVSQQIFDENKVGYSIEYREEMIEDLIMWIYENINNDNNMKKIMLNDLKTLLNSDDTFVLSSLYTNELILQSNNNELFNEEIINILEESEKISKKNKTKKIKQGVSNNILK